MNRPRVCVVGASNIDLVSYVPRLPVLGETLHGSRFSTGFGGKGANQAVMAAKLGASVAMVSKVGRDDFGDRTLDNFRRFGVDVEQVSQTDRASTGVAPIFVDPAGNNAIVIVTGANDLLEPADIDAAGPAIDAAGVLLCQLEIPVQVTAAALRAARRAGTMAVLNPAPARDDLPADLLADCDVLCPNQAEAGQLTGRSVETVDDAAQAARDLLGRGPGAVVVTLGPEGCIVADRAGVDRVPGCAVEAVDSTGAGDAFVGALGYYLARGDRLPDAAGWANRIAALSVCRPGTQASYPDRGELPPEVLASLDR